jgi:hypothetical protein
MLRFKSHRKLVISVAMAFLVSAAACGARRLAPSGNDQGERHSTSGPAQVSPQVVLAHQPDFVAEVVFTESEARVHGGFSLSGKIAKKGECYREEFSPRIFFFRFDLPTMIYHSSGTGWFETASPGDQSWHRNADHPQLFAHEPNVDIVEEGVERIDGHECIKIIARLSSSDHAETVEFYAAKDLMNLVIAVVVNLSDRTDRYAYKNILLAVPESLFTPLENYRPPRH